MEMNDERFSDLAVEYPDASRLQALKETMDDNWNWAWTTSIEIDKENAEKLLEEKLSRQA